jgi:hypothetical protein
MKLKLFLIFIQVLCFSLSNAQNVPEQNVPEQNDPKKHPRHTNTVRVGDLQGHPIDFYLKHKNIDNVAKMFYKGEYAIYDDEGTFAIIDSVMTTNVETQPFYFFVFNRVMDLSDGSVAEFISTRCTQYIKTFPCQFLSRLKNTEYKTNVERWAA